jgi:hypothetical protein
VFSGLPRLNRLISRSNDLQTSFKWDIFLSPVRAGMEWDLLSYVRWNGNWRVVCHRSNENGMRLAKMHFIAQLKSCSNKNPHNSNETLKDWFSTNFLSKTHMLLPLTSCLIYFNYDKPSNYLIGCYIIPSIQKCRPRNLCLTHASMLTISKNPLISCFGGGQSTSKRFLGW